MAQKMAPFFLYALTLPNINRFMYVLALYRSYCKFSAERSGEIKIKNRSIISGDMGKSMHGWFL